MDKLILDYYTELNIVLEMEYCKISDIEIYLKESDAIEAFEGWIELSYEDYANGYKMEDKYIGSCIMKRRVIINKKSEDDIIDEVLKYIMFSKKN